MARLALALTTLLAGSALAQPVTHPDRGPCRVTIELAPADARAEIEAWVRAEPRCERELEVRVVPTEDGLFLSARDRAEHVRERVVPDAQSAAVLVVSWMADDSMGPDEGAPAAAAEPARHAPAEPPPLAAELAAPAGGRAPGLVAEAPRLPLPRGARRRDPRWLSLGAIASTTESVGLRGQLDLLRGSRLELGVAGGWLQRDERGGARAVGQARLMIGTSRSFGRLSVRAQLGLGADLAAGGEERMDGRDEMDGPHRSRASGALVPTGEAGVLATVRIGDAWGLVGGPLVGVSAGDGEPSLAVFLGMQRGL